MSTQPTASELLQCNDVIEGMRRAYYESGVGTDRPIEQGGFIVRLQNSEAFTVARLPAGAQTSLTYPLCVNGTFQGHQIVASFHTHPNTGPEWQQDPSPQDIRLSQDHPETMGFHQFVISREKLYHSNDGDVTDLGVTRRLLGLDE